MGRLHNVGKWMLEHPVKSIILCGAFIRLFILFLYGQITIFPDSYDYIYLSGLISDLNLSGYDGSRTLGYPLLLVLALNNPLIVVGYQMVIGIVTLILIYKTVLILWDNKKLALLFALACSLYLPIIFFEYTILTESLTLFFIVAVFYVFLRIYEGQGCDTRQIFLLALICTCLVLIKPFYIFLPILLFFIIFIIRFSIKGILVKYSVLIIFPVIAFLGLSYINKVNTNYFVSTTLYGFNLAQNCVSFAENTTPEYSEIGRIYANHRDAAIAEDKNVAMSIWYAQNDLKKTTMLSKNADLSAFLYNYSTVTIKKNPVGYLKQVFVSWRDFWKVSLYWNIGNFKVSFVEPVFLAVYYIQYGLMVALKILFIVLFPCNIIDSWRQRKLSVQTIIGLIVFTASVLQAFVTYGTNARYSFPFEVLIVVSVLLNWYEYRKGKRAQAKEAP